MYLILNIFTVINTITLRMIPVEQKILFKTYVNVKHNDLELVVLI